MKKFWVLILTLMLPMIFVGCENKDKNMLSTPKNLTVLNDGVIVFERVDNDQYYVINIDNFEFNVFLDYNKNVTLYSKDNVRYLEYDASDIFELGKTHDVKVKAKADKKKDSEYTNVVEYVHTTTLDEPTNVKIINNTLTWDVVKNANLYKVKIIAPNMSENYPTYTFSLNKFDFSSILSSAGKYTFEVSSSSLDNLHKDSNKVSIDYYYNINLATPQNGYVYKDDNEELHLVSVIDKNSKEITIYANDIYDTKEIESYTQIINKSDNIIDVNLNKFFNKNFSDLTQYNFKIQTLNKNSNYLDSEISQDIVYNNTQKLPAPLLCFDKQTNTLTWNKVLNASGYTLFLQTTTGLVVRDLDANSTSYAIESELIDKFDFAYISTSQNGNYKKSYLSNFISINSAEISTDVIIDINGNNLEWTSVEGANYILEIGEEVYTLSNSYFNLAQLNDVYDYVKLSVIKDGYAIKTVEKNLTYFKKLSVPYVYGISQYVLKFQEIQNAIGYKIYLIDKDDNQTVINQIFTSNSVDISSYLIKEGVYGKYYVKVQAIAGANTGYSDSNLSSQTVEVIHTKQLDKPDVNETSISIDANGYYYLNFNNISRASYYEIIIKQNLIRVEADRQNYKINLTNYMQTAGEYPIVVRALPDPTDNDYLSSETEFTYTLTKKLDVVNAEIVYNENDSTYTLVFDRQTNANSYKISIIKFNDGSYNEYLSSIGLENNFEVFGPTDITAYLQQAGEYNIYVVAMPKKYYIQSEPSEPQVVSKMQTLKTPVGTEDNDTFKIESVSKDELNLSWIGDDNADYYIVRITTPKGKLIEQKTTNNTCKMNINNLFTTEGDYGVEIRSMVNATGENSKYYISSSFSSKNDYSYNYILQQDFERYSVNYNGESFNFAINTADDLINNLWRYYLYNDTARLSLIINQLEIENESKETTKEDLRASILRLANEIENKKMYKFSTDSVWTNMIEVNAQSINNATDIELFSYIVNIVLEKYPELAVLQNKVIINQQNNIFRLIYNNKLDDNAYTTNEYAQVALDYGNKFNYLLDYERRSEKSYFNIDYLPSAEVSTSEQLVQVVQYGYKPNFVLVDSNAEKVYNNAKTVLRAICGANMSDYEKATKIFDWLMYAYNIDNMATSKMEGDVIVALDKQDYAKRQEFYLEGVFLNISQNDSGEFEFTTRYATSESLSKAFTLMCAIEGIETRKVNANYINDSPFSFNKIYLGATNESDKLWYAVDIANSDNYNNKNVASHLYYMVDGSRLNSSILEYEYIDTPAVTNNLDYYTNFTFNLTKEQINLAINADGTANIGDYNSEDISYLREFDKTIDYKYTPLIEGDSALNKYLFNCFVYCKYYLCYANDNKTASFEFTTDTSVNISNIGENSSNSILNKINTYYISSVPNHITQKQIKLKSLEKKQVGDKFVYILTVSH